MQKWEYCKITTEWIQQKNSYKAWVWYLTPTTRTGGELKRDKKMGDSDEWHAAYRLVAQLGTEGWEMSGTTTYSTLYERIEVFWFKRPLV